MPNCSIPMIILLALIVVKEWGEGNAPQSQGFFISEGTLSAVQSFAEAEQGNFGDPNDPTVFATIVDRLESYLLEEGSGYDGTGEELRRKLKTDLRSEVLGQHVDWVLRDPKGVRKSRSVFHGSWKASNNMIISMFVGVASLRCVYAAGISDPNAVLAQDEEQLMNNTAIVLCLAMQASPEVKSRLDSTKSAEAVVEGVIK